MADNHAAPHPYDLTDPAERMRLFRELRGYMQTSLKDGTDREGRQFALDALVEIVDGGKDVLMDDAPKKDK